MLQVGVISPSTQRMVLCVHNLMSSRWTVKCHQCKWQPHAHTLVTEYFTKSRKTHRLIIELAYVTTGEEPDGNYLHYGCLCCFHCLPSKYRLIIQVWRYFHRAMSSQLLNISPAPLSAWHLHAHFSRIAAEQSWLFTTSPLCGTTRTTDGRRSWA